MERTFSVFSPPPLPPLFFPLRTLSEQKPFIGSSTFLSYKALPVYSLSASFCSSMASISKAPILPRPPVRASKLSALYLTRARFPCGLIARTVAFSAPRLTLSSPAPENPAYPVKVGFSGETSRVPSWSQLLRRRVSINFPVCSASAEGGEIEVSDGYANSILARLLFVRSVVTEKFGKMGKTEIWKTEKSENYGFHRSSYIF